MRLFELTEAPGTWSVGLQVIEQYDSSRVYRARTDALGRPYGGNRTRPLQTLIWYPAARADHSPMTVREYLSLWTTETHFDHPQASKRATDWLSGMAPSLAMPLWAVRNAPPASGRFPTVLYAPGCSNPSWDNADLCEYLASHGYVVMAGPSLGAHSREMTMDLTGANAQAQDISFLAGHAASLPNADASALAVVGFSWGGLSNVVAAARDDRIRALVTLDGSVRFSPGVVAQAKVVPSRMGIPLLSIAQGQRTPEEQDAFLERFATHAGPNVLNAWTGGDLICVSMLGLSHMEHCSMYQRNEDLWWKLLNVYGQKKAGYGRDDGITGYAWIARYTLAFLDAYLKELRTGMEFLRSTPTDCGAPPHFIATSFRAAVNPPATIVGLRAEVARQGFRQLPDIHAAWCSRDTGFRLPEDELRAWAEELLDRDCLMEAVEVLKLNVQLHPYSSTAHERLSDAYQRADLQELSIEACKQALQADADNADARMRLKHLSRGITSSNVNPFSS